uniref:Uncharacterized protein n=1 Tax=Meloidogyne incognita TaxID=6306 RepID=A0A914NKL5_MELIC
MMPEKRKEFDRWYSEHKQQPFFLDEELASYCTNDVEILLAALIAFRREFMDVSKGVLVREPLQIRLTMG